MEFFADRNLGTRIFPAILRDAGLVVHLHQDHFPQNAPDVLWVAKAAEAGWPIISPDKRISRDTLEVEAAMTSGAAMFCMSGGHHPAELQARNFLRCLPAVLRILENTSRPFIAKIYQPNPDDPADQSTVKVRVVLTLDEWEKKRRR
ncbi:MAG TPA: hypothetical protein VJT67_04020 [Longimicrobiaceae bacterium]|nr:hypothetical protein [Longimicrobiaceae bacterium]